MGDGVGSRIRRAGSAVALLRLLLALSLVGPAALLALVTLQSHALLIADATRRADRMAELLAQQAANTFDGYNLAFGLIEEHLLHAEGLPQERLLHDYLGEVDQDMPSVDGLTLIGADGMAVAHSRYFPAPKTFVGDRDYIRDLSAPERPAGEDPLRGRDGLYVGVPVKSRYSGRIVLPVARARRDITGRVTGALVVSVARGYFEELYRTLALSADDRLALIRLDGRVLAQIPAPPPGPTGHASEAATADASGAPAPAGSPLAARPVEDPPADPTERITGLHKVEGYPVRVEVGLGLDRVLAPWRRQSLINLAVAALATLGLFAVVRLAMAKTRAEAAMQERLLAEAHRLADAEAALRQAQKMEALGQLTGGLAHDFNNLLNIVLVNLELAAKRMGERGGERAGERAGEGERRGVDLDRVESHLRGAVQGAERGVALTRRLLAFAHRQEAAEAAPIQVRNLVFGLVDLLGQAAGAQIRITLDLPRGLPPARADANELETALLNLVVNARDAMPKSGRIHIALRQEVGQAGGQEGGGAADKSVGKGPRKTGGEADAPRFLVLSVRDEGSGMDAAMLARVTEPFFTTKGPGKGSGLGLAMVERFATEAGGGLRLHSRPGEGTLVEIRLPAA